MKKVWKDDKGEYHFESDDGSVMTPEEFLQEMNRKINGDKTNQ